MLQAAGYRSVAAGNVGTSLVDVVTDRRALRGRGRRAVQLPAALEFDDRAVRSRRAERRRAPPGLARHLRGVRRRQGARSSPAGRSRSATPTMSGRPRSPAQAGERVAMYRLGEPGPGELGVAGGYLVDMAFRRGGEPAAVRLRVDRRRVRARSRPPGNGRRRRTTSPTRSRRPPWPGPTARRRRRSAAGLLGYPARPAPDRAGRDRRRRRLRRRLQGDQPAAAAAARSAAYDPVVWVAGGLLKGADDDLDRLVSDGRAQAARRSCCSAPTGPRSRPHSRDTRRMSRSLRSPDTDTGTMDLVVRAAARLAEARRYGAARARPRSRSTCSATTRPAATRSPTRSGGWRPRGEPGSAQAASRIGARAA